MRLGQDVGGYIRHQHPILGAGANRNTFINTVPEAAVYLAIGACSIAKSTVFNNHPDALCVLADRRTRTDSAVKTG